ncbi:MAG: glycosyltransferase, partial [Patescibacteria group bacterium]
MAAWFDIATREAWVVILTYFPLGVIGLWRWTVWLVKKGYAATYRVKQGSYQASVAVVTPVYNENPAVFRQALESWKKNEVDEIVAVIDYTDEKCLAVFKGFSEEFAGAKLIVTKTPGKRPALVDGIREVESEVVALVDSDTIWADEVKKNVLMPFQDPKVGGVSSRQSVLEPKTLAQRIFNAQLNLRYLEELPFMLGGGGTVVTCISGRTAFYRKAAVMPLLDGLLHETFWGKSVISGDDKRLTYLVEAAGWKAAFQQNAHVFTPGMPTLATYFKQRLRWTRNSWRADLRTLTQPWVYKYPRFVWYLTDRVLQPFAQLLSPISFIVSLALGLWIPAVVLFVWWHISRVVRMWPHLRRQPRDGVLVPLFVTLNFYNSLMKIYALVTLNRQGWITRWGKERLPGPPAWLRLTAAYGVTAAVVAVLAAGVTVHEGNAKAAAEHLLLATHFRPVSAVQIRAFSEAEPPVWQRYEVQSGDTVAKIAQRFNVDADELRAFNEALLPSLTHIEVGLVLTIPPADTVSPTRSQYSSEYEQLGPIRTTYVAATNTLEVRGRGQQVTLRRLRGLTDGQFVRELSPGEWYVGASLVLKAGVSLRLSQDEVRRLKLESGPQTFASIIAEDGQIIINGVTVTSWDSAQGVPDTNVSDGRSYLAAKGQARMDIFRSEVAYLGYDAGEAAVATAGVSWFV